ncbi:hypothetical protein [Nocardia sp. SC052]|uniref:hypothetical protein n=1 Tax=Nocardia sichangensis TaxID=3385975 RepID=UPI0039A0EFE8
MASFRFIFAWSDRRSRALTLALAASLLGVASARPVFDGPVDSALAGVFGENISDLVHVLFLVARNWLVGLIALRPFGYQRAWTTFMGAVALAMIVTSRAGDARRYPVSDEWELHDALSVIYSVLYALTVGATSALVVAAAVVALQSRRGIRRAPMIALAAVGVIGITYAITTIALLIAAPGVLSDYAGVIVTAWSLPLNAALAVAGLYGLGRPRTELAATAA